MAMRLDQNEMAVLSVMEPGITYTIATLPETGDFMLDTEGGRGSMILRLSSRKLVNGEGRGRAKAITLNDAGMTAREAYAA